jgi:hypothetical protein
MSSSQLQGAIQSRLVLLAFGSEGRRLLRRHKSSKPSFLSRVVSLLVPAVSTAEAPRGYRLIIQTSLRGAEQVFCAMRPRVSTLRHRRRPCRPPPRRPARAPFVPARAPGATPPPAAAMPQRRLVFGGREMGRLISQLTCEAPERLLELAGGQCCRRCCNSQSRTGGPWRVRRPALPWALGGRVTRATVRTEVGGDVVQ